MTFHLIPASLEFLETAPYRCVSRGVVSQPPEAVFAAISEDPAGWGDWFPGFSHSGRYLTAPPYAAGAVREVTMSGVTYREEVLAWDAPERWAFFVDRASLPVAHSLVEDYRVEAHPEGSELIWTFAIAPRGPMRLATPAMGPVLQRLWTRATRNLSRSLG